LGLPSNPGGTQCPEAGNQRFGAEGGGYPDLFFMRAPADRRAPADTAASGREAEAEEHPARGVEQEVASGRTAATPVGALLGVVVTVACLVLVVLALVVLALAGSEAVS